MDAETALLVIRPLSERIDPLTGEEFDTDSTYQNSRIVRALAAAATALEHEHVRSLRQRNQHGKAGMPWTSEEDDELLRAFDNGETIQDLVKHHQRSPVAIRTRLQQFDKLAPASRP